MHNTLNSLWTFYFKEYYETLMKTLPGDNQPQSPLMLFYNELFDQFQNIYQIDFLQIRHF